MLTFTTKLPEDRSSNASVILALTAEERTKSRDRVFSVDGDRVCLKLPRGTVLRDGDCLESEDGSTVAKIIAKPEPVLTATSDRPLDLLKAAYHLGNRHVPLEVNVNYLRLSPDPVLRSMVKQLGLKVVVEEAPFQPETGAYGHSH